jgi:hypothetical protein
MILEATARTIRQRIEETPAGTPFTSAELLEFGTRASIDQTLSRLVRAGVIERIARGVFVKAEVNRFVGKVMPEPAKVAAAVAKASGSVVQIHGAEAARRFGLSTQTPLQPVFSTSGPSRVVKVGAMEIRLNHVGSRKLALVGRPSGEALAALWYLGRNGVTPSVVQAIRSKLSTSEFEALRTSRKPSWMSDAFFAAERHRSATPRVPTPSPPARRRDPASGPS